jgi:hypothetical protein
LFNARKRNCGAAVLWSFPRWHNRLDPDQRCELGANIGEDCRRVGGAGETDWTGERVDEPGVRRAISRISLPRRKAY